MSEYCCDCGAEIDIELKEYSSILSGNLVCPACAKAIMEPGKVEVEM